MRITEKHFEQRFKKKLPHAIGLFIYNLEQFNKNSKIDNLFSLEKLKEGDCFDSFEYIMNNDELVKHWSMFLYNQIIDASLGVPTIVDYEIGENGKFRFSEN